MSGSFIDEQAGLRATAQSKTRSNTRGDPRPLQRRPLQRTGRGITDRGFAAWMPVIRLLILAFAGGTTSFLYLALACMVGVCVYGAPAQTAVVAAGGLIGGVSGLLLGGRRR